MWNKIMEICGFLMACVMALLLGKQYSQKKAAEKEAKKAEAERKAAEEQVKKEAERKEIVQKMKAEIFKEKENEKQKLNTGDAVSRFNAANDILRNGNKGGDKGNP